MPAVCVKTANSSIHAALSPYMPRRCLRRVFSRTRCLTSVTRLAVSYISFEPPFRFVWKCDKKPFTYIGTKNRKNSHPKRKIFQKNLRAAKKQLSGGGYSVKAQKKNAVRYEKSSTPDCLKPDVLQLQRRISYSNMASR